MIRLHDYWRSGAGYRVRIALNLKGLAYERVTYDLRSGAHRVDPYSTLNPQGLVPTLEVDGKIVTQSLAIIEWLEERVPSPPLLPADVDGRAIVRAMAAIVAADIHPLNNLRVLTALRTDLAADDAIVQRWIERWINEGFSAIERLISQHGGSFAFGDAPTFADCCLAPQVYSAERFCVSLDNYPNIRTVADRYRALPAFSDAHPDKQADAAGGLSA